jgi:hypothetical protein
LKSNNKRYNIDDVAIDDEAGFTFNNGTIEGEGHKTGPGTEQTTAMPGYTGAEATACELGAWYGDDDQGADGGGEPENKPAELVPEDGLAELIQGQVRTTWMLANDSKNENFCLGFACVDGGDDGYSPLRVFELGDDGLDGDESDDDGNSGGGDGDEHHHGRQAGRAEDETNRQAGRLGRGLTGAERRWAGLAGAG